MNSIDPLVTAPAVFKKCMVCVSEWHSRNEFLEDRDIKFVGYQVDFENLTLGLFLFNHSCRGTLAIQAGEFRDLYNGPVFKTRVTGSEKCLGYCLHQNEFRPCPADCECAYVREIIQTIKNWTKR